MYHRRGMGVVNGQTPIYVGRVKTSGRDEGIAPLVRAGVIPMEGRETVFDVSAPVYQLDTTPAPAPTPQPNQIGTTGMIPINSIGPSGNVAPVPSNPCWSIFGMENEPSCFSDSIRIGTLTVYALGAAALGAWWFFGRSKR